VQKQAAPGNVPTVSQLYGGCKRIRTTGKCVALGNSREPPAETFLGRVDVEAKFVRRPRTRQSGSPPGGGSKHVLLTYHPPFDDEDENEARGEHPQPATREQFREGASNWVDTPFLQATTFEHERQTPNAKRQTPGKGASLQIAPCRGLQPMRKVN